MPTIHAIYENGVFRPLEPVDLPDGCEVQIEVRVMSQESNEKLDAIYEILSERYESGQCDTAEHHNEHQP